MIPLIDREKTGRHIKAVMEECGLTALDVQKYLSLGCVQSIYHWFYGASLPSIDNLYALSELFMIPMDALICGDRDCVLLTQEKPKHKRARFYYIQMRHRTVI